MFDRFAKWASDKVASAWFFMFSVFSILVWLPSFPLFETPESWQLPINTFTTIATWILVALLHNDQNRSEKALHAKIDTQTRALLTLLKAQGETANSETIHELNQSIGIEHPDANGNGARG